MSAAQQFMEANYGHTCIKEESRKLPGSGSFINVSGASSIFTLHDLCLNAASEGLFLTGLPDE